MKNFFSQRGYTLLFAVLTAALVLGVAVFILSVSRKQYILATTARDSLHAFYAADSGIECMAADPDKISTSTRNISCNGRTVTANFAEIAHPEGYQGKAHQAVFNFGFIDTSITPNIVFGCATVEITGYLDTSLYRHTVIRSNGHNLCDASYGPDTVSQRAVERTLELIYE